MRRAALSVACVLTLAAPSVAQAAQRYAAPGATGPEPCVQKSPCSIETAVEKAKSGDEVIVGPGFYTLSKGLQGPVNEEGEAELNVYIHGDLSGPMPTISVSPPAERSGFGLAGITLSWVNLAVSGATETGVSCFGARIERVRVTTTGEEPTGISMGPSCVVSDSVVVASGEEAVAISASSTFPATLSTDAVVNSTVQASGINAYGAVTSYSEPNTNSSGEIRLDLTNSIVHGARFDLATAAKDEGTATILASHSNFITTSLKSGGVLDAGGNQIAAPLFVDAAGGNYEEAAGSPTIDAGIATPEAGSLNLAGNARTQGGAIDIGAYEVPHAAPPPPPPPAKAAEGKIEKLSVLPRSFAAARSGEAITSKKKSKGPIGGSVVYTLSAAANVTFSLEKISGGRKAGKRCVKQTKGNRGKQACDLFKPLRGSFADQGSSGLNTFDFSGRLNNKTLTPGRYLLVARAGGAAKTALFNIVR